MKEPTREQKRDKLINSWNEFTDGFLYEDKNFTYKKCCNLISDTKEYFNTMQVANILTIDDCRLYEAASALRFLPNSYCPSGAKMEEFIKSRLEVAEMFANLENMKKYEEILIIKQKGTNNLNKRSNIKTEEENKLDTRWDDFLNKLTKDNLMQVLDFQKLFFDTFWYFRNRKDVTVLGKGGWHILSCLCSLCEMPFEFIPVGCEQNEYNAARCLSNDLIYEINSNMTGYYYPHMFVIENLCTPPAGCSPCAADMSTLEAFSASFYGVVSDFDDMFDDFGYEEYLGRYNF